MLYLQKIPLHLI